MYVQYLPFFDMGYLFTQIVTNNNTSSSTAGALRHIM